MNIEPINKAKPFQRSDKEENSESFLKDGTCIFYKIMRLDVRNKFQCTLGRKFSVFGYSHPNMGINQSELANQLHYFTNTDLARSILQFLHTFKNIGCIFSASVTVKPIFCHNAVKT